MFCRVGIAGSAGAVGSTTCGTEIVNGLGMILGFGAMRVAGDGIAGGVRFVIIFGIEITGSVGGARGAVGTRGSATGGLGIRATSC